MQEEKKSYGFIYYFSFFFSMLLILLASVNLLAGNTLSSLLGIKLLGPFGFFIFSLFISIVCLGISKIIELLTDMKNANSSVAN